MVPPFIYWAPDASFKVPSIIVSDPLNSHFLLNILYSLKYIKSELIALALWNSTIALFLLVSLRPFPNVNNGGRLLAYTRSLLLTQLYAYGSLYLPEITQFQ